MMSQLKSIPFADLDPGALATSAKHVRYLDVVALVGGDTFRVAALVARGSRPGPTIAVLGGVHGDEYEGPHAIRAVFAGLDPRAMAGTFIGIPVVNVPAFATATRTSRLDGLNLARVFPGKKNGTPTERVAYLIGAHVIARCDFLIDLHSGGSTHSSPTLVGYLDDGSALGNQSREAAIAFGAPVIWGHPGVAPGRTLSFAIDRGIPCLYTECAASGWLVKESAAVYARGVTNVMKHLGMLGGAIERDPIALHLRGTGTIEESLATSTAGFLLPHVAPLDRVRAGDLLGEVLGLAGEVLEEIRATADGVVVFVLSCPSVNAGNMAFLLAQEG